MPNPMLNRLFGSDIEKEKPKFLVVILRKRIPNLGSDIEKENP